MYILCRLPKNLYIQLTKDIYLFACGGKTYSDKPKTTLLACAFYPAFYDERAVMKYRFPYDLRDTYSICMGCKNKKNGSSIGGICYNYQCDTRFNKGCTKISSQWSKLCGNDSLQELT